MGDWTPRSAAEHNARYGYRHRAIRAALAPDVAAGLVDCARCRERIEPGTPWDLGHVEGSATEYAGPMHQACNRDTVGTGERPNEREPARLRCSGTECHCPPPRYSAWAREVRRAAGLDGAPAPAPVAGRVAGRVPGPEPHDAIRWAAY